MSSISSLSTSSGSLAALLQSLSQTSATSSTSTTSSQTQPQNPEDFLTSELEKQGYTGSSLSDLQAKIEAAVQSVQSSSNGTASGSQIHDAINSVLQSAGVNTDEIDSDFKAAHPRGHHRHHSDSDNSATTPTATDSATGTDITQLLQSLGVDPAKFESALESAVQNQQNGGTLDLSKIFASAGTGSQINVLA